MDISGVGKECKFHVPRCDPVVMVKVAAIVVPALCAGMADENAGVRHHCLFLLRYFGEAASPAIPLLRSLTNDPDDGVREAIKQTLEWIEGARHNKGKTARRKPGTKV